MGLPERYTSGDSKVCAPSFRQQEVIDEGGPTDPARILKLQSNIESYILGNVDIKRKFNVDEAQTNTVNTEA